MDKKDQQNFIEYPVADNSDLTILIVDDDEGARDSLTKYLQSCGWNTLTAESGEKAIEFVKSGQGDIIISDVRMPGMNGIELTRKIKNNRSKLRGFNCNGS